MGTLCKTEAGQEWKSKITHVSEGVFTVDNENAEGFFEGGFFDGVNREKIVGKCDGTVIYFLRPAEKPRYYYVGTFDGDDTVRGTRVGLPAFEEKIESDEEWEGTKIPTLIDRRSTEG